MKEKQESSPETVEDRVASHPFFEGMESPHLKVLTDCAMAKNCAPGDYLFRQGDFANRFYLIEEGTIVLEALDSDGKAVVVEELGANKLVGWSWLFPPHLWHFDARATEPTTALFFYGTILREACAKDPSLGFALFKRMSQGMAERLQAARARLFARHTYPADVSAAPRDGGGAHA
jgi:CRP-like cAMP-binding protein